MKELFALLHFIRQCIRAYKVFKKRSNDMATNKKIASDMRKINDAFESGDEELLRSVFNSNYKRVSDHSEQKDQ